MERQKHRHDEKIPCFVVFLLNLWNGIKSFNGYFVFGAEKFKPGDTFSVEKNESVEITGFVLGKSFSNSLIIVVMVEDGFKCLKVGVL